MVLGGYFCEFYRRSSQCVCQPLFQGYYELHCMTGTATNCGLLLHQSERNPRKCDFRKTFSGGIKQVALFGLEQLDPAGMICLYKQYRLFQLCDTGMGYTLRKLTAVQYI